jgi:hypothetical protein
MREIGGQVCVRNGAGAFWFLAPSKIGPVVRNETYVATTTNRRLIGVAIRRPESGLCSQRHNGPLVGPEVYVSIDRLAIPIAE